MTEPVSSNRSHFGVRLQNAAASFVFIACSYLVYRFSPHARGMRDFTNDWLGLSGAGLLSGACLAYGAMLLFFYLSEKSPRTSKSVFALRGIRQLVFPRSPGPLNREERVGLLSVLLKGFFAPVMFLSLYQFSTNMVGNARQLMIIAGGESAGFLEVFNSCGYWFLYRLILFLDVLFFTIGYLVEHPRLRNEIRSVDPTVFGWVVALACYPPFNSITAGILGGNIADFPHFESPALHLVINILLLVLMAVYTWASVALNFKASNLTHRGIVSRGPYRFVRHPAYAAKNLAWWLGALPVLILAWERSMAGFLIGLFSVAGWNMLYILRALTEEAHLRSVDGEYEAYCHSVRHRFIPGVI